MDEHHTTIKMISLFMALVGIVISSAFFWKSLALSHGSLWMYLGIFFLVCSIFGFIIFISEVEENE